MMGKDQAVSPKDDVIEGKDQAAVERDGWALYEEETSDGKTYRRGPSRGKPMKNVVLEVPSGPVTTKMAIPREAFVDMVRQYFDVKGY